MKELKLPGQKIGEDLESAIKRILSQQYNNSVQLPHISKEGIEALYGFGYALYTSGHYEKALHFFQFLTLVDIDGRKHWMALAAVHQVLKNYDLALQAYAFAALQNPLDPYAHWHAAECFLGKREFDAAIEALQAAKSAAKTDKIRHKDLLNKLLLIDRANTAKAKKKGG